jgi:hypothetical protein
MAQPFPPAGNQSQRTERPRKIYAEQYREGYPVPIGATTETQNPVYADGRPHVITPLRIYDLKFGDWVISSRFTGQPLQVISDEEFQERFGGGPAVDQLPTEIG